MKVRTRRLLSLYALLVPIATCAEAQQGATILSGFGTVGGVYNSGDEHGFIRNIAQETPPGRQYTWRSDTRLGIQAAHTFNPQWQIVGQLVLREQADHTPNNTISRAFVSYRPDANLHMRFGRLADATFLMSDHVDVGYVYPWARPPVESYAIIAPPYYDGADVTYSVPGAGGIWRIKGLAGRIKTKVPQESGYNYTLEGNDLWGLALIREKGPLKLRLGYSAFHLRHSSPVKDQLSAGLKMVIHNPAVNAYYPTIAAEALALLNDMDIMGGARIGFASAGIAYDDGKWMAQAEISDLSSDTRIFPLGQQGYVSVGYRRGEFLPYVMASGSRAPKAIKAGTPWGAALGSPAGTLQHTSVAVLNSQRSAQTTLSLGVRWDFASNAALKLQWDHVRVRRSGWGVWSSPLLDDGKPDSVNLLSASIDFVF